VSHAFRIAPTSVVVKGTTSFGLRLRGILIFLAAFSFVQLRSKQKPKNTRRISSSLEAVIGFKLRPARRRSSVSAVSSSTLSICSGVQKSVNLVSGFLYLVIVASLRPSEGFHGIGHGLDDAVIRGFQRDGFFARAGEITGFERLAQRSPTVDITIRPERAIAFQVGAAFGPLRAGVGVPPPDREGHALDSSSPGVFGVHGPFA
jgi:hypothetical protein